LCGRILGCSEDAAGWNGETMPPEIGEEIRKTVERRGRVSE